MKDEKIERIFLLVWMLAWSLWEYSVHGISYTPSENGIFIYSAVFITVSVYYYFTGLVIISIFNGLRAISKMLERVIENAIKKI